MIKNAFFGLLVFLLAFGFIGCDNGNGDTDDGEFTSSTNESILNDANSLGLVGTSVSSSNVNVATAVISSGKIKITSLAEGNAVISVKNTSDHTATINISISKTGSITIGTIVKYINENIQTPFEGSWLGWNGDGSAEKIWKFTGNEFLVIIADENNAKGTFTYTENVITFAATHAWDGSKWLTWSEAFGGEDDVYIFSMEYTITGNNLSLEGDGNGQPFTKIEN